MDHAHGAMRRNSYAIEKSPRVSKVKSLCTREFAVLVVSEHDIGKGMRHTFVRCFLIGSFLSDVWFDTAQSPNANAIAIAMRVRIFQCSLFCVEIDTFPTVSHAGNFTPSFNGKFVGMAMHVIDDHSLLCTHSTLTRLRPDGIGHNLKPPNSESILAHVDIHAGWGNHGMTYCSEKLSLRAFHRTILPHDPMTGVACQYS